MRKKGFTLIELLAVIVILSIIALISTPIIIGVIEKARKGAFEDSAYGVLEAGKAYFVDKLADQNKFVGENFVFPEGGNLKISGEKPVGGTLSINDEGKEALAIWDKDKKWCAFKYYDDEKIVIQDYKAEDCKVIRTLAHHINSQNRVGNTEGLFTDDFGNVRYRGKNNSVRNYVKFNNELWRIIGIFDGQVKLIHSTIIENTQVTGSTEFFWNTNNTNDWPNADLQTYLNTSYYNGINPLFQNMISTFTYYLGGIENTSLMKKEAYQKEREKSVYAGRSTEWNGKIGLMYVSDYGYAAGEECTSTLRNYGDVACKENNWLYKDTERVWTITPISTSASRVTYIDSYGIAATYDANNAWVFVRPTLYLKSNVEVVEGNGSIDAPYQLSL